MNKWTRLGLRFNLTEDDLDPMAGPALAVFKDELRAAFIEYANHPDGLFAEVDRTVVDLRAEFSEKNPSLRIRYAAATKAESTEN